MNFNGIGTCQQKIVFRLITLIIATVTILSGCQQVENVITTNTDTAMESTIKIGLIQPGDYYVTFGQGVLLAQQQLNKRGGVLGSSIEVIQKNNQLAPNMFPDVDETITLATELVQDDEIVALIGPIFSTIADQVGPTIQKLQRPTILGSAGTVANAAGDFIFLSVITNAFQGKVIAEFATDAKELNAKTAATVQEEGDVYSTGHVEAFVTRFEELGGKILTNQAYQRGDTSFSKQLQQIQEANPDVILLSSFAPEVPLFIKEARDMGIKTPILGGDTWDEPEKFFSTLADNTPLEGIYQTTNFAPEMSSDEAREFFEAYKNKFGKDPDGIASSGYDAMLLIANAIQQAKSTDPIAIRNQLSATRDFQASTYISYYDENRHPVKSLAILTVRNGKIQTYKIVEP